MLNLGPYSTVAEFSSALSDAAKELYSFSSWVYPTEISPGEVILSVESGDDDWKIEYFKHAYEVDVDGDFTFGEAVEMRRVSQFVAA